MSFDQGQHDSAILEELRAIRTLLERIVPAPEEKQTTKMIDGKLYTQIDGKLYRNTEKDGLIPVLDGNFEHIRVE